MTSTGSRNCSTAFTPAPKRATRSSPTSICSNTRATKSSATLTTSSPVATAAAGWTPTASATLTATPSSFGTRCSPRRRQMMLFEWSAMSRPIVPGDRDGLAGSAHELRLQSDVAGLDNQRPGRIARTHHRPRRRLLPGTGGPVPRQTRQPHRHRQLQTVSIHRRGFPAQLSRHDRHSD